MKQRLLKRCVETSKIKIMLTHIGLFGLDVLFIAPGVTKELLELQEKFDGNYADGLPWTAHTTMLIDQPQTIQKALPVVAKNFMPCSGYLESVRLYEFWPTRFIAEEILR